MGSIQSPQSPTVLEALSPQSLARNFAAKSDVARHGVRVLYEALLQTDDPEVLAAFQMWTALFGKACGIDLQRPSAKIGTLATCYGAAPDGMRADLLLFALHTYYALLVKLLLGQVMAHSLDHPAPTERLLQADQLRQEMQQFEAGGIFRELGVVDFFRGDPFSWYTAVWSEPIEHFVRQLAACLARHDAGTLSEESAGGGDLLGQLYQELFPRPVRHILGEYYTPDWLVDHVLDVVGYSPGPEQRLLDPACGSGTFLVKAVGRILAAAASGDDRGELCRKILANVVGFDLNPLAVMAARANYLIAIRDLLPHAGRVEIPVHLCDSILDGPQPTGDAAGRFDFVVGNPPWIAWDNLPEDYRRATKPLWERYGLFSLSGNEGRHGGGKKDLAMLMLHVSADRYLQDGGRLALVVTQTLFQTKGAGDGFRRFRLGPKGDWLKVLRVDDMVALRPFRNATNRTSTIVLQKGAATQYPVPYVKWSPGDDGSGNFTRRTYRAEPIEPDRPGSPWFLRPAGFLMELAELVGASDYTAHLGANTGGANGVYWMTVLKQTADGVLVRNLAEKNQRGVDRLQQVIEPELLYPLIRWADVKRYHARPSAHILLAQDAVARTGIPEAVMRREYPRTFAFLKCFDDVLTRRAAYRRYQRNKAFYSMYNVGPYTVAPIKVVWRRMDRQINAAVVEELDDPMLGPRPVIPQETCVIIACESAAEAHYVCAVLNSSLVNFLVTAHSVCGGKGFGTPGMLDFVPLRRFLPDDPRHAELAACSRQAHEAVAGEASYDEIQRRIDSLAGKLWGLPAGELEVIASL